MPLVSENHSLQFNSFTCLSLKIESLCVHVAFYEISEPIRKQEFIFHIKSIRTKFELLKLNMWAQWTPLFHKQPPHMWNKSFIYLIDVRENCDTWHKLINRNSWIYIFPKPVDVTLNCESQKISHLILYNTAILTLNQYVSSHKFYNTSSWN